MKKFFFFSTLLIAFIAEAQKNNEKTVTIVGKVSGDTKGYNQIYFYSSGVSSDSVAIKNGQFIITVPFTQAFTQLFYTQYEVRNHGAYRPFPLLVDGPGTIKIDMNIQDGFFASRLSGPKAAVLFHSFLKQQNDVYEKITDELTKLYGRSWAQPNDLDYEKINSGRDSLTKVYMGSMIADFVKKNHSDFVSAYVLASSGRTAMNIDQLKKTYRLLSARNKKSEPGEKVAAYIHGVSNTAIGKQVKNFVLSNPKGKSLSFEQFKGKYVWVDFWASWCVPCKKAFPYMRELYSKYKGDQFDIVGISTDATKEPWLKAVNEIQNPWPQLWDNKNIASEFAVTAFPTSFLIGPDGKIILKEVGFEPDGKSEMEKKLRELFPAANANEKAN
jgi:thiol-disulfide isomerase/thioredoxin